MAKDKERSINPAQQARKQEKNRALKKAKNEQQARRNEKLARRNPDRINRQIEDLKALEASGEIKPREKAILADLERDLRAVKKAREALGEKAPTFGNAQPRRDRHEENGNSVLGKRGRDGERRPRHGQNRNQDDFDSGGETDESVRAIPMPRDTPPPIPRDFRRTNQQDRYYHKRNQDSGPDPTSQPPAEQPQTTYSAAPQIRDLRKEATSRFVPAAVKRKQDAVRGVGGGLLEPDELDRLEAAGYYKTKNDGDKTTMHGSSENTAVDDAEAKRLAEEEARFEKELAAAGDMDVDVDMDAGVDTQAERAGRVVSAQLKSFSQPRQVHVEEVIDEDL